MSSPKLFSPGPIDVSPETFAAMSRTMIGHRGSEFEALYASLQPGQVKQVDFAAEGVDAQQSG